MEKVVRVVVVVVGLLGWGGSTARADGADPEDRQRAFHVATGGDVRFFRFVATDKGIFNQACFNRLHR